MSQRLTVSLHTKFSITVLEPQKNSRWSAMPFNASRSNFKATTLKFWSIVMEQLPKMKSYIDLVKRHAVSISNHAMPSNAKMKPTLQCGCASSFLTTAMPPYQASRCLNLSLYLL
ncbi:hypothetical protein MA16_Dca005432 [Dendrobium catenatum]|uniref:Uncharacterized protein n=1 Tax=Dendrobium catenatum TaxID=906689 RepID=A0A2I0X3G2_9ASPA|nr:hypothetical protein MA16_Dca005432 [Dendrobium catenatum]